MQHVAEEWRSPIGSAAIMVIIAYFASEPDEFSTDEARQEWAAWYLEHLQFAYRKSSSDNKKVEFIYIQQHNN